MKKGSEKTTTTKGGCNTLQVASHRLRVICRPHRENSIKITKNGLLRDIHHEKAWVESIILEPLTSPLGKSYTSLRTATTLWPHQVKKLMTGEEGVVGCGCNNHSTAATVRISAKEKTAHRVKAGIRSENKAQTTAESKEESKRNKVKAGKVIKEEAQVTAKNQNQNTPQKLDEPYPDVVAFPETGELSLFKSKTYKVSVSIELHMSHMRPIVSCR